MEFMSAEHVSAMNGLLEDSDEVRQACRELPRAIVVSYRLLDGPRGDAVYWTMSFGSTVQFALEPHPSPDLLVTSDWRETVRSASAGRRGEYYEPPADYDGDKDALVVTAPAMAVARAVATMPTDLPDV